MNWLIYYSNKTFFVQLFGILLHDYHSCTIHLFCFLEAKIPVKTARMNCSIFCCTPFGKLHHILDQIILHIDKFALAEKISVQGITWEH